VRAWVRSLGATPAQAARASIYAALLWLVTPMSWVTGSHLGLQHLGGHFTKYGESIWTDPHPVARPWVALRTLIVYGLGAGGIEDWRRLLAGAGWIGTLVIATELWLFRAGTPDANAPLPACGEER
jgi:hypothetical protein